LLFRRKYYNNFGSLPCTLQVPPMSS
jgi:hypothetical protein